MYTEEWKAISNTGNSTHEISMVTEQYEHFGSLAFRGNTLPQMNTGIQTKTYTVTREGKLCVPRACQGWLTALTAGKMCHGAHMTARGFSMFTAVPRVFPAPHTVGNSSGRFVHGRVPIPVEQFATKPCGPLLPSGPVSRTHSLRASA